MERGIVLNLFEVNLPDSPIRVMSRDWDGKESLQTLQKRLLPYSIYGSQELNKIFAYEAGAEKLALEVGFTPELLDLKSDPRLTGRLILDAITNHIIIDLGFDVQNRPHTAIVLEGTDVKNPIQQVENRVTVYPSFRIQTIFLNIAGNIRYFLMINPKVRYRFVHTISQIHQRVSCEGRYIRINCPLDCSVYECELYDYRGRLAGKFTNYSNESTFECKNINLVDVNSQFVVLDNSSRFNFPIPVKICELEASIANINTIFSQRYNPAKASSVISELRVIAGDLLPNRPRHSINVEVGKRRWIDITAFVNRLADKIPLFGEEYIQVDKEPLYAVEGGYTPEDLFVEDQNEDQEELEDETDTNAF